MPPGTPPIAPARRAINRATRLRWLAGRRDSQEAWDAFEAVAGVPLDRAGVERRAWPDVRWWLLDLARECAAQSADDRPPRRADRVWVLDSGSAKLVDDPAVDQTAATAIPETAVAPFLLDVARAARGSVEMPSKAARSRSTPSPLRGHQFLERLAAEPGLDVRSIVGTLETLTHQRAVVTRGWRAVSLAVTLLIPGVWALVGLVFSSFVFMSEAYRPLPTDVRVATRLLRHLERADRAVLPLSAQDREGIEVALATRYRSALKDDRTFAGGIASFAMTPRHRTLADDVLRRHAAIVHGPERPPSPAVEALVRQATSTVPWYLPIALTLGFLVTGLLWVALVSPAVAVMFRGGAMRLVGLELVTADGRPASRLRVLARTVVAWSPLLLLAVLAIGRIAVMGFTSDISPSSPFELGRGLGSSLLLAAVGSGFRLGLVLVPLLILLAGAGVAIIHPARGIQDRLAGTWIVPR